MSLFNRRKTLFLLGAPLGALASCGFSPVYGPSGNGAALRHSLSASAPKSREGYALLAHLQEAFGEPSDPTLHLTTELDITQKPVGITRELEITRYHVVGTLTYSVTNLASQTVVKKGSIESFSAYSATGTTVDALTTPRDARRRLVKILSDKLVLELLNSSELAS